MRLGQSVSGFVLCVLLLSSFACNSKQPAKETQSVSPSVQQDKASPAGAPKASSADASQAPAQSAVPQTGAKPQDDHAISYAKNPERFVREETVPAPFSITDPKTAQEHFDVAINYDNHQQLDKAIEEYKETLQLQPDWALVHFRLAKDYQKQGRGDDAISEWEQATRSDPHYYEAYNQLALAYKAKGYTAKWAQAYSKLVDYPNSGVQMMAHYELGFWYEQAGDRQKAKEHLENYRKLALKAGPEEQQSKRFRNASRELQKLKE